MIYSPKRLHGLYSLNFVSRRGFLLKLLICRVVQFGPFSSRDRHKQIRFQLYGRTDLFTKQMPRSRAQLYGRTDLFTQQINKCLVREVSSSLHKDYAKLFVSGQGVV